MSRRVSAALAVLFVAAGCASAPEPLTYDAEAHRARVAEWRAWRHDQLVQPDGWLTLAGLYWLPQGDSTFGGPGADLVYGRQDVPPALGSFAVDGHRARFAPAPGVEVRVDGQVIDEVAAYAPYEGFETPIMQWDSLRWFVMRRNEELAIRLRDTESPVLTGFAGTDNFELDPSWWISGRFEPYDPPKAIRIPNIASILIS